MSELSQRLGTLNRALQAAEAAWLEAAEALEGAEAETV